MWQEGYEADWPPGLGEELRWAAMIMSKFYAANLLYLLLDILVRAVDYGILTYMRLLSPQRLHLQIHTSSYAG